MISIGDLSNSLVLALSPPKKAGKMSQKIETLRKEVARQRQAMETAENKLTFCCLSEKKWNWIGTITGALAFAAPFSQQIYQIVQLDSSDSQCEDSAPTKAVGIIAASLAITYISVKSIVGCLGKKRDKLITPLEKQIEEMRSLERLFTTMSLFTKEEEPVKTREERFVECTREMQEQKGSLLTEQAKQKWMNLLVKKLPKECEIKQLFMEGKKIAKECVQEGEVITAEHDESSETNEKSRHSSLFDRFKRKKKRDVEMGVTEMAADSEDSEIVSMSGSDGAYSIDMAAAPSEPASTSGTGNATKIIARVDSGSDSGSLSASSAYGDFNSSIEHISSKGGSGESSSSSSSGEAPVETPSRSPKAKSKSSTASLPLNSINEKVEVTKLETSPDSSDSDSSVAEERRARLSEIAQRLNEKLGIKEFYNPSLKVYFDTEGHVIRKKK